MSVALELLGAVVLFGAIGASWMTVVRRGARREHAEVRGHFRARRAHYAAVEAAEDDPTFSPVAIEEFVIEVVALADHMWRTGELADIKGRPDASLVRAWARSRRSWLGDSLSVRGRPAIDIIRVVNRDDDEEDRVVVRVRMRVRCKQPWVGVAGFRRVHLDERWTIGHSDGRLLLVAVGGDPLAGPVLTAPLVPNRSSDDGRLREESLAELADAQKVDDGVDLRQLVAADEPPALALPDLSVVDGRFAPDVVAGAIARLLEVWEWATAGSEEPLAGLASAEATTSLLRPQPGMRLILRDAVLRSWQPTSLDLGRRPPAIEVTLEVDAIRFVATSDGGFIAGNQKDPRPMHMTWTLELSDHAQLPWRLATSNDPAEAVPGWS